MRGYLESDFQGRDPCTPTPLCVVQHIQRTRTTLKVLEVLDIQDLPEIRRSSESVRSDLTLAAAARARIAGDSGRAVQLCVKKDGEKPPTALTAFMLMNTGSGESESSLLTTTTGE